MQGLRFCAKTTLAVILMGWCSSALGKPAQIAPKIKISFPSAISLEKVWLTYELLGPRGGRIYLGLPGSEFWSPAISPFDPVGGQGHIVEPKSFDHYYEIVAREDGQPVDHIKALAWTRGCQMVRLDAAIGKTDVVLPFTCVPLRNISLSGHLQRIDLGGKSDTLTVSYYSIVSPLLCTNDGCNLSGPGLKIPDLATATVTPDGSFNVEIPDLAEDPVVWGNSPAEFELHLTSSHITLEPEAVDLRSPLGNGLRIAPSYPGVVIFERSHS